MLFYSNHLVTFLNLILFLEGVVVGGKEGERERESPLMKSHQGIQCNSLPFFRLMKWKLSDAPVVSRVES